MISRSVSTECGCWVNPSAQQMMVPFDSAIIPAALVISSRLSLLRVPSQPSPTPNGLPCRLRSFGLLPDEGMVDDGPWFAFLFLQEQVAQRLEQREIAAHFDLQELISDGGASADNTVEGLGGSLKFRRPASGSGLTAMIFPPLFLQSRRADSMRG